MNKEQSNFGIMEDWKIGIMEFWNIGFNTEKKFFAHHSVIPAFHCSKVFFPLFHHSIVPMGLVHRLLFNVHRPSFKVHRSNSSHSGLL
jgi:hypothetical protein